jgi:hypothetical protein
VRDFAAAVFAQASVAPSALAEAMNERLSSLVMGRR